MAKIFQPKVIIGSVFGVVASAIGLVALFFPSLFNLETKKIDTLSLYISARNDVQKLYDFLKVHEEKIVRLDLSYDEPQLLTNDTVNYNLKELEYPPEEGAEGKGYSIFGENKLFFVSSDFKLTPYGQSFLREKGGFGFWCRNPETTPENELDFTFQIGIPHGSQRNTIYFWGKEVKKKENSDGRIVLRGVFYVHPLAKHDEYGQEAYMSMDYYDEKCWQYGSDTCGAPDIFELEPLNKKDLQLKNY